MKILFVLGVSVLTACTVSPVKENSGPAPVDASAVARQYLLDTLIDPGSLSQFKLLTSPQPCTWTPLFRPVKSGWCVDYEFNAKNRLGGYVGKKVQRMMIRDELTSGVIDVQGY